MKKKCIIIFILCVIYIAQSFSHEKMKLYALYTPSHEILKDDFFLPSIQDDFDIIFEFCDQTCASAKFMDEGWTDTTMRKVDLIIRAIQENWGSIFIFSDVDIQFFSPVQAKILQLMEGKDMVIQRNSPNGVLCSGFFACCGNERTLQLWQDVKTIMQKNKLNSDQKSLNQCIKRHSKKNPYNVAWAYLPKTFFGGGTLTGFEWVPGMNLPIPNGIMMHHANWTKGIKNKIAQLIYVRNVVCKRKNATHLF
jgi:Nucleotide-diphospho-sugar transferase